MGVRDAGWSPTVSEGRQRGLPPCLGAGRRFEVRGSGRRRAEAAAAAGRAGCSGLEIPSTRESREGTKGSEEWRGTLRTPVLVRGSVCPCGDRRWRSGSGSLDRPSSSKVSSAGVQQPRALSQPPLAPARGTRAPRASPLLFFTSVFPAGTGLGSLVAFSQTPL